GDRRSSLARAPFGRKLVLNGPLRERGDPFDDASARARVARNGLGAVGLGDASKQIGTRYHRTYDFAAGNVERDLDHALARLRFAGDLKLVRDLEQFAAMVGRAPRRSALCPCTPKLSSDLFDRATPPREIDEPPYPRRITRKNIFATLSGCGEAA